MSTRTMACSTPAQPAWSAWTIEPLDDDAALQAVRRAASGLLALPFDAVRAQYGAAVELGLIRRSMLDGHAFEQALGALERLSLGAFARQV